MSGIKITDTIHAWKHSFRVQAGENVYANRFVYSYILLGERICLIDAGVRATAPLLLDYLKGLGRSPREISMVVLTHAHPDHIGGCAAVRRASPAEFCAHAADRPWIEDVEKQSRERPILNFFELVEGPVPVGCDVKQGSTLLWGPGKTLKVLETPGHSFGSISLFLEDEGALFSGDAVPAFGTLPIYVDPRASIRSIRKLKKMAGVRHLLSSWHDPISGNEIQRVMDEGIRYIEKIDGIVRDLAKTMASGLSGDELSIRALERLGIRMEKVPPMVGASFQSHLK